MFTLKRLKTLQHVPDCSPAHIFTQNACTYTKCYAAASPH